MARRRNTESSLYAAVGSVCFSFCCRRPRRGPSSSSELDEDDMDMLFFFPSLFLVCVLPLLTETTHSLSLSRLLLLFPAATFQLLSPREPELLAHTHNISKEISEINSSGIFFSPFFSRNCQLLIGLHKLSAPSPVKFFCNVDSRRNHLEPANHLASSRCLCAGRDGSLKGGGGSKRNMVEARRNSSSRGEL